MGRGMLSLVSGLNCIGALEKVGYVVVRQKLQKLPPITVPNHKELRPRLLQKIPNDVDLTVENFILLL
jgi:predicted RNA binding protein YcfA (HicA-like mRNA interferase family)